MERFIEWAETTSRKDLKIISGFFPSYNFDVATYGRLRNWLWQKLDAMPTPSTFREVRPFFHIGHGTHLEAERITEADHESLPQEIAALIEAPWTLRSERDGSNSCAGRTRHPSPSLLN